MTEKTLDFSDLTSRVLLQLRAEHYKDSSIVDYRRFYKRVEIYMQSQGISEYSVKVGEAFMETVHVAPPTLVGCKCKMRRLDDCLNGLPYRSHHGGSTLVICDTYKRILEDYLQSCEQNGNRSSTLREKRKICTRFLNYVEEAGCCDISKLTPELITKSLLIFENKANYAMIHLFLRYLADSGHMDADMSGIIPHYKQRIPLPTVYSIDEIQKIENAVDISTDTGVRNLAMIRLATRMGLRAGDIAKLRWGEIDFEAGQISFIQEKTGQPQTLSMPGEVAEALHEYFKHPCPDVNDDYVFHGMKAPYERISTSVIRYVVNECIKHANIDIAGRRHGPRAFRSSLATSMVNDDISYETVRKVLGHSDPNVVKRYARTDIDHLRVCAIEPPPPSGRFAGYLSGSEVNSYV